MKELYKNHTSENISGHMLSQNTGFSYNNATPSMLSFENPVLRWNYFGLVLASVFTILWVSRGARYETNTNTVLDVSQGGAGFPPWQSGVIMSDVVYETCQTLWLYATCVRGMTLSKNQNTRQLRRIAVHTHTSTHIYTINVRGSMTLSRSELPR